MKNFLTTLFAAGILLSFSSCLKKKFTCDCHDMYSGHGYTTTIKSKNSVEAHSACESLSGSGQYCVLKQ